LSMLLDTLFDSKGELLQLDECYSRQLAAAVEANEITEPLHSKLVLVVDGLKDVITKIVELSNELE
jgi:hypothetical protein